MTTIVRNKSHTSGKGLIQERIFVDIPQSEVMFFQYFANKMGWQFKSKQNLWDDYLKNSPENTDLSEEEIIEEVRALRYGEVQDNH